MQTVLSMIGFIVVMLVGVIVILALIGFIVDRLDCRRRLLSDAIGKLRIIELGRRIVEESQYASEDQWVCEAFRVIGRHLLENGDLCISDLRGELRKRGICIVPETFITPNPTLNVTLGWLVQL